MFLYRLLKYWNIHFKLVKSRRICVCWFVDPLLLTPTCWSLIYKSSALIQSWMKLKCEGRQEEELTGFDKQKWLIGRNRRQRFQETLGNRERSDPQTDWRKWLPQTEQGTLTVHWKHLATELATRRLLLSYSGAGSTELSPKPAGP